MATYARSSESRGTHALFLLLSFPFLFLFHGWALKTLWNWFIPDITGWPRLGIAQAIGLALVVSVFKGTSDRDKTPAEFWYGMVVAVVSTLLTVGVGFIVHGMA